MRPTTVLLVLALLASVTFPAVAAGQHSASAAPRVQPGPVPDQPAASTRFQLGLGMMIGVPVGSFGDHVELSGGTSGHFDVSLGRSLVSLGGEVTGLWYGNETREVPLSSIPELSVTVDTTNYIVLVHGRLRVQAREGRVRPYVDGLVGFIDLFTTTSIDEGSCTGCSGDSETHINDIALSAGGGAGLMVEVGRSVKFDVSVRYLAGGEAEYLTEGAVRWEGGQTILDVSRSRTDIVLVYIGVALGR